VFYVSKQVIPIRCPQKINSDKHFLVFVHESWVWYAIVSGSFEAHCRRSGMTFLRSQWQGLFRTFTSICLHAWTRLEGTFEHFIWCTFQTFHVGDCNLASKQLFTCTASSCVCLCLLVPWSYCDLDFRPFDPKIDAFVIVPKSASTLKVWWN